MIVVGIILFALLVIVHEYGHFRVARSNGVTVEEFGFGFPPRLLAKKFGKGKTLYSLNLIPLGGFVKLKGESTADKRPRSFGAARFKTKTKILMAGVAMNVVAAFVLLTTLALTGLPRLIPGQFSLGIDQHSQTRKVVVAVVEGGSPASQIGLTSGDYISAVDGQTVENGQQLSDFTHSHPGEAISVSFTHSGASQTKSVVLAKNDSGQGILGIAPFDASSVRYTWAAPIVAAVLTLQLIWLTVVGLFSLISGLASQGTTAPAVQSAVGPVGIFALLQGSSRLGLSYVVFLIIIISVSLAVINTLPLPALDGGRLALIGLFRTLKKPLSPKLETAVHAIGFVVLLGLAVLISIFDVKRFF